MHDPTTPGHSRREYAMRMHRVVEYIDRHLDDRLELATLAEVAHFSPFHFHRLFAAWMGETVGDYVRRRRIEVAATRLAAQPRLPVLHVALWSASDRPKRSRMRSAAASGCRRPHGDAGRRAVVRSASAIRSIAIPIRRARWTWLTMLVPPHRRRIRWKSD